MTNNAPEKNISIKYTPRPYQKTAIKKTVTLTKNHLYNTLETEQENFEDISAFLEMATGSGKTFTVGSYLDYTIRLRNRYNRKNRKSNFQELNILTLTNRIDGLNQFRDDLCYGGPEEKKPAFLSEEVMQNMNVETFHSKADNLDTVDKKFWVKNEEIETVEASENISGKDNLLFSTFQTADLKGLPEKLPYLDIIIIDEAHNVRGNSEYHVLLEQLRTLKRNGKSPLIIPVTATPTSVTKELFGEPTFTFGLGEYLASEYSPGIDYRMVTSSRASKKQLIDIQELVDKAKKETNITEKRSLVKNIEKSFEEIMSRYPSTKEMVTDLIQKRIGEKPGETILYANSIDEADELAKEINNQLKKEVAISYHSQNDKPQAVDWSTEKKTGLERFASPVDDIKIIIAIGKLNESVDIPKVENVVFWKSTDIEKVFLQQFGRGLRGDGIVKYFDYVGGIKNFAWIGSIQDEYIKYKVKREEKEGVTGDEEKNKQEGFLLSHDYLNISEHNMDIYEIFGDVAKLGQEVEKEELTKEEIISFFGKKPIEYWLNLGRKDIYDISLKERKIGAIGGILEWKGNTLLILSNFHDFIYKLYGKEKPKENTILTHINELNNLGIKNTLDLLNFGPVKYQNNFGVGKVGTILQIKRVGTIHISHLKDLAEKLGFESIQTTFLGQLEKEGIKSTTELINFGVTNFQKTFGYSIVSTILGKKIHYLGKKELLELGLTLGLGNHILIEELDKNQLIEHHKNELLGLGIINFSSLKKFGRSNYQKHFGITKLNSILDITLKAPSKDSFIQISKILWDEDVKEYDKSIDEIIKEHRLEIIQLGIKTSLDLHQNFKIYRTKIGEKSAKNILGLKNTNLKLIHMKLLAKKLQLETAEETHRKILSEDDINSLEVFKTIKKSAYIKKYKAKMITYILGRTIEKITDTDLEELGKKLFP